MVEQQSKYSRVEFIYSAACFYYIPTSKLNMCQKIEIGFMINIIDLSLNI